MHHARSFLVLTVLTVLTSLGSVLSLDGTGALHAKELTGESPEGKAPAKQLPTSATAKGTDKTTAGVTLLSGKFFPGLLREVRADGVIVGDHPEIIPLFEIQEIRWGAKPAETELDLRAGAMVKFRDGEALKARVISVQSERAVLRVPGLGEMTIPVAMISAFRLREVHPRDGLLVDRLKKKAPPEDDLLFARRGSTLLAVSGTFRGLDADKLLFERRGRVQTIERRKVQGLILAPSASTRREPDPPAVFAYRNAGNLPAYLVGVEKDTVTVRFRGARENELQKLPRRGLDRTTFASDRVVFLSTLEPSRVVETPLVGKALNYRNDRSVGGGPITLEGRVYRRGLGVHSKSLLEFSLTGQYKSFAAVIGLDDAARGKGSVTFRVAADGKVLFVQEMAGKDKPRKLSLPLEGVNILSLEVDYGSDQLDMGDHADWALARVSK